MNLIIKRDDPNDSRIFGTLWDDGEKICETLELPDRDNHPQTSCCPLGTFTASIRWSNRHQHAVLGIDGVPGRSGLAFDVANYSAQLLGCVAVGLSRGMLGGREAILSSGVAMRDLMTRLGCKNYDQLQTPEDVSEFIADHPESQNIPLTFEDT